jgi:hypothetical protein
MAIVKTPTMQREEEARNLVTLFSCLKEQVDEDKVNLRNCILHLNGVLERYYTLQDTPLSTAEKLKRNILLLEHKKCDKITSDPRCNVHDIAEDTKSLIGSVLSEVKALGLPTKKTAQEHSVNVTTNVSQNQEQSQTVIVNILLDAIKDELTGRQRKEILEIAKNSTTPEEARKSILDKLKEFGSDVTASIVANIITNPNVWSTLSALL